MAIENAYTYHPGLPMEFSLRKLAQEVDSIRTSVGVATTRVVEPSGDTTGVTDALNIQAAHDTIVSSGGAGVLEFIGGGRYYLSSTVSIRTPRISIIGNSARVFSLHAGALFDLIADTPDDQYGSDAQSIENLKIVGPGNTVVGSKAFRIYSSAETKSPRPTLKNIYATGFETGIWCGSRAYLAGLYNVSLASMGTCFHQTSGTDAGENIHWHGGTMGNSGTAVLLEDDTSQLTLLGVSIDYCSKFADVKSGCLSLYGCHLERHSGYNNTPIDISGDSSIFHMVGGDIIILANGSDVFPYNFPSMVYLNGTNTRATFQDVKMTGIKNADDVFATGTGVLSIERMGGYNTLAAPTMLHGVGGSMSLLADGSFEQTSVEDYWYVASDQSGTYTSQLVSGALTLSKSTDRARSGTKSMKITRGAVGNGYTLVAALHIPLPRGRVGGRLFGKMYCGKSVGAGDLIVRPYWVRQAAGNSTNFRPNYATKRAIGAGTTVTGITDTAVSTPIVLGNGQTVVPAWADGLVLEFDVSYSNSGLSFYLDDICVEVA